MTASNSIEFRTHWFGRVSYQQGLERQARCVDSAQRGVAHILGFEFDPVITLGRRAEFHRDLKSSPEDLKAQGVELVKSARGGEATLHSPGQLVIYPVLHLRRHGFTVRSYVQWLQSVTKMSLARWGVKTEFSADEPGLYTSHGKVAFFGLHIQRGVSQHGLAINVHNDLRLFGQIVSCGVVSEKFDQVKAYRTDMTLKALFETWQQVAETMAC